MCLVQTIYYSIFFFIFLCMPCNSNCLQWITEIIWDGVIGRGWGDRNGRGAVKCRAKVPFLHSPSHVFFCFTFFFFCIFLSLSTFTSKGGDTFGACFLHYTWLYRMPGGGGVYNIFNNADFLMYLMDPDKTPWEKDRWKLHKNSKASAEYILEAASKKKNSFMASYLLSPKQ